ncbi:DUF6582 domain-containing protein [Acidiphilium sp.]|uniref:DUF6582 domain-containing protein n=1 Tax=Acidiphilium sp. TaxID=527 RepID=UPI002CC0D147|nr:DUF6582 domain-containing protein [Acidiphilium sp.]HQT62174.1 NUDIX domain-containing protein [Acidiphilium sp.]
MPSASPSKPECAGVVLRANGKYLLLRRVENGVWEQPGGHVEEGEARDAAALREAAEECGLSASVSIRKLRSTEDGPVKYTTFVADVDEFEPKLSREHTASGWFSAGDLPAPIHPEVRRSIDYIENELETEMDAAHAIRDGRLPSGFKYENTHLVALRIFGTGVSYRTQHKEFTFRDPEIYLSDETLARCNGLPVIVEHPPSQMLDAEQYENRNIGAVMLPYVKGDEVWGIARVYDGDIAAILASGQLSTSPGVRVADEGNAILPLDGEHLLIEGNPKLIDHIAIVANGVWDKGGPPSGLRNDSMSDEKEGERKYGDVKFADPANDKYPIDTNEHIRAAWDYIHKGNDADKYSAEDLAAIKRRIVAAWKDKIDPNGPPEADKKDSTMADDASGGKAPHEMLLDAIGKLTDRMDSISTRMDSMESARDDKKDSDEGKPKAEDKKDADDKREEEKSENRGEKADKKDADKDEPKAEDKADAGAENAALRAQIAAMQSKLDEIARPPSYEEMERIAATQARADSVMQLHGSRAPQPMSGESSRSYRLRVLAGLRGHSERFKDIAIDKLDGAVLDEIERGIFTDAQAAAANPKNAPAGRLIPVTTQENGHTVTRFHGDIAATFAPFMAPPRRGRITNPRRGGNA